MDQAELRRAVNEAPGSDPVLVAVLKAAVERGDYRVDAGRVARRLMALETELGRCLQAGASAGPDGARPQESSHPCKATAC